MQILILVAKNNEHKQLYLVPKVRTQFKWCVHPYPGIQVHSNESLDSLQ